MAPASRTWRQCRRVAHTPTTPADDRALRLLERTPVPDDHKQRLFGLVQAAQACADEDGTELQAEFGKEAVALIVGCNQFIRLFRAGERPGDVELLLDDPDKQALSEAGWNLREPDGMIFRMFGWVRVDPMESPRPEALQDAVASAYRKAQAKKTA